jgi:hypothetical protein
VKGAQYYALRGKTVQKLIFFRNFVSPIVASCEIPVVSTLIPICMSKLRILYVASEIDPFLKISEAADLLRQLPQAMQERGWRFAFWFPGLD